MTTEQQQILARAREILTTAAVDEAEKEVRLQVLKAAMTGTATRPDDDYPEIRNPKHWVLFDDVFIVAPGSTPVEAITDLWVVHENDGVPTPRIRCYKYSSLILIEGYIQYFHATGNSEGLAALNRLLGHRAIPQGLPNRGDDLLWKRRHDSNRLLPGDQVWVDNPFFDRGRELIRQEAYDEAIRESKPPHEAAATAVASTNSLTAGEEGSNVFCLGDDKFMRGACSLSRLSRHVFRTGEDRTMLAHEQVRTPMIFTLRRFQEHMIDDNYTAQACLRADPATVRPEDFKIESIRSPLGPAALLRHFGRGAPSATLDELIDGVASHNRPPRLVTIGASTAPLFGDDYDWSEQRRVRTAMDTLMRTRSDDLWWRMRASIGDNRYVLTASRGGVARNFTVGAICSDIIDQRLCLGFTAHLPSVPGRLPATFQPEQEYWQHEAQWSREHLPLYLMQVALCRRALVQWDGVQGTSPGSDGHSGIFTADERAKFSAALVKEIAERETTKKARYEEVAVPWLPAPNGWEGFDVERAKVAREQYLKQTSASQH